MNLLETNEMTGRIGEVACLALLGMLLVCSGRNEAFPQRRRAAVKSPEVHPDRRVTFRIRAPRAGEVGLFGSLAAKTSETAKDDTGLCSITVGALVPDLYEYAFMVDGVRTVDAGNPELKVGRGVINLVEVPAEEPAAYQLQDAPHGAVCMRWYASKSLGRTRRLHVYLPPGYESDPDARYPVLYLLHGAGDNDSTWVSTGRANFIADNLLAGGKVRPMIIVMPDGHAVPRPPGRPTDEERRRAVEAFQNDLLGDVIPYVEGHYRVLAGAESRAIAGLSMGGGQSLYVGLRHLDQFAWVGAFSSAVFAEDLDAHFPQLSTDPKAANSRLKLFWIGCGRDDFLLDRNERFVRWLQEKGVEHTYRLTEGSHNWSVWRAYLEELLPQLFADG